MLTRRGFLAGSAAALLADATAPSWAQQTTRTRVIDVHAHWYPPQWLELVEKEAGANGGRVERNARGNMVIVIPGLSQQGAWHAQIEGVRTTGARRGQGIGKRMIAAVMAIARERGCASMQLLSNKSRIDAQRFYRNLGFAHSHEGMKVKL